MFANSISGIGLCTCSAVHLLKHLPECLSILYYSSLFLMPFLLRTWFSFLSGFIFPSPFPSPSLFWTNKLFSCLHWIFWSHSSSIRRCFGSMKYISCGYHFISSICTFWRLCLVKCKIAMLYKLLKGWRRRLYEFWLFKSEGISKEVMLLVKWAHLG